VQSALDMNLPSRDLFVTPGHCLYIDGYLIPAAYLVNGTSIALSPQESRDVIEYFHIEFEGHEVIYAEGVAVESFHVRDGHEGFENYRDYERLYGSANGPMVPYAPVLGHNGVRQNAVALVRSALSQWIDVRDPIQIAYDRIAARARLSEMRPPELASAVDA